MNYKTAGVKFSIMVRC